MDKKECKKYLKRAYRKLLDNKEILNVKNIEYYMKKVTEEQMKEYVSYSKIAVNNMISSGNVEITIKDLLGEIDILPKVYTKDKAIYIANKL